MMRFSMLLLLAGFVLVLMTAGEVDAGKEPLWSYEISYDVESVAISADGEYIVAGSYGSGKVYLFDKDSSTPLWNYSGGDVESVAISADGEYIVAGSNYDFKVHLFDKDSNTPLWSYDNEITVMSVDISADGEYIVVGGGGNKVTLFNKDSSTPLWNRTTGGDVHSVAISADGKYITAGSDDNRVYLFNKESSTPLWNHATGVDVRTVAISADGEYIVAGSEDNKVRLFDKSSSTPLWNYTTEDDVRSVAISADGEYIAVGSYDKKVYLFDKDSSTPLWSYEIGHVKTVAISADGEYIVAGADHRVFLFNRNNNTPLWHYGPTLKGVQSVAISADGEYIVAGVRCGSGDDCGSVYLLDNNVHPTATIDYISPSPARFDAEVTFNGSGLDRYGTVVAYEWISDIDGFLSDEEDFSITGFSVGTHTISFRVQDNEDVWSGKDYADLEIYPNAPPIGTIDSISPLPARFDAEVTFNGTGSDSDGTVVAYLWESDIDGFLSDEEDFTITGLSVGDHAISFWVQDNHGEWSGIYMNPELLEIYPNDPPVANIDSIIPSSARFDAEVTFSGSGSDSDGTIVAYEWSSDIDGFLSDEEDFSITGFSVGTHTISLRVQDNDGDWSDWSMEGLHVYPNSPPVGTIDSIEPSPAEKGDEVTFSGTGSDTDGTVVAYLWKSSIDGELSTDEDFSSSDLSLGQHEITFQVQDNDGAWSDSPTSGGNGSVPGIQLWIYAVPVAIAGQDSTGTPGVPLQFSGAGTDEDGTIAKYEWDFDGDGVFEWSSPENGRELNIYNNEGTYTATLRVTDNDGFTDTDTVEVTISEKKVQIDDDGNVIVTDAEEDEEGIPTLSVITTMAAVAVMALRRRPE